MEIPDFQDKNEIDFNDSLFILECGVILVGCSGSDPAHKWSDGVRTGHLYCVEHSAWHRLVDVLSISW
jgi:hypothetical protein